jgi:hypothetical protein
VGDKHDIQPALFSKAFRQCLDLFLVKKITGTNLHNGVCVTDLKIVGDRLKFIAISSNQYEL